MSIIPYKNRKIDLNKKVRIYRNLNHPAIIGNTDNNPVFSILQNGLVIGHTIAITLHLVNFIVSQAGRERVLKEKRKNVHAFIQGYITDLTTIDTDCYMLGDIAYNPYLYDNFVCTNLRDKPFRIYGSIDFAFIRNGKVTGFFAPEQI